MWRIVLKEMNMSFFDAKAILSEIGFERINLAIANNSFLNICKARLAFNNKSEECVFLTFNEFVCFEVFEVLFFEKLCQSCFLDMVCL